MDKLNVFRRGSHGKCRNYVSTNEPKHYLGPGCAVISPLYSEEAHGEEEWLFSASLSKGCMGTTKRWALTLSSRDLRKTKILTAADKFLEGKGINSTPTPQGSLF